MASTAATYCVGRSVPRSLPAAAPALARVVQIPASEEDVAFMRLALKEEALGHFPFGAVIVRDGAVLARGRHLGLQARDPTAHGEMVAIRRFLAERGPDGLKGTTLYTSGEPCPMCMGAIVWCGISRVVFGASIEDLVTKIGQIMVTGAEIADRLPFADITLTGGVLAKEPLAQFK